MNVALAQLLTTRATMDSSHRELELNAELTMCMNDAQGIEAIKEAEAHYTTMIKKAELHLTNTIKEVKVCHTTNARVLQQTYRESMLALECEMTAEKGWDCQALVEAFGAAFPAWPPKTCEAMVYPLQLLTDNVLLATILGMLATTPQLAVVSREPTLAASFWSVLEMPTPLTGMKWWHFSSDQGVSMPRLEEEDTAELDVTPKKWPCQKQEGRPVVRSLRELPGGLL